MRAIAGLFLAVPAAVPVTAGAEAERQLVFATSL